MWVTATGLAALSGCLLLALVDPRQSTVAPPCPWLLVTGRWCPGCGGLRAVASLLRGDVAAALGWNPLVVVVLPPLALVWLFWALRTLTRLRPPLPDVTRLRPAAWTALGLAVGAFWVLRNVALPPFSALAP